MPHPVAVSGFSSDPWRYERGRPGYPPEAVRFVLDTVPNGPDDLILDVGAGTGKLTRALTATAATVVAIDPVEGMVRLLPEFAPGALVVIGVAERLPVAPGSVSVVTVAQAFHWFDPDRAWTEFARVLRPDGAVALVWNARLREVEWVDRIWSLMDRIEKTAPWRNHDQPDPFAPHPAFADVERASFLHTVGMDEDTVIARVMSVSHAAVLPAPDRRALEREISTILADVDGPLDITYRTDVAIRRRL